LNINFCSLILPEQLEMGKKKHGFLKGIGIFLAVCLFFELVLRLFGYGDYTVYRPDERLLWVPQPGRTLTVVNHLPITINDQGFRYPFDLKPKHGNEFRIIAFGDSATQGWGVDDQSHYSAILENMLNHGNCAREHFQVISAGVNAYPNSLVAEKLKEVLEDNTVQPDIAIVAYSHNSNFEKLVKLQGEDREKFLHRVEFKAIVRRSALYNFLIEGVLRRIAYYQLRHLVMAGTLDTLNGMDNLDMDQFNQGLEQSLELTQARHIQMVLLLLGNDGQTPSTEMHPFQKAMMQFAETHNVPLVNMIPVISTKNQAEMFMDPAHPTAEGHQVIAGQLLQTIHNLPPYQAACGVDQPQVQSTSAMTPQSAVKSNAQ
jgi:lysophospholipase L1-like esterase